MSRGAVLVLAGLIAWALALLMTAAHVLGRVVVLTDAVSVVLCVSGVVLIFRGGQR